MIKLILLRHGQSTWNKQNRFTGWTDVPLTKLGIKEGKDAAKIMKKKHYSFDIIFTNVLKRAIHTTNLVVKEMNLKKIKIIKAWQLNEMHYGALQGLNKSEMAKKFGEKQVLLWRRSYDIRPPSLKKNDKRTSYKDPKYRSLKKYEIPLTESLKDTVKRVFPYWKKEILPELKRGKKVLISGSGNSLRALVKIISKMSKKDILKFNIPTGIPLVYELDNNLKPVKRYFLGNSKDIAKRLKVVKEQGKAR